MPRVFLLIIALLSIAGAILLAYRRPTPGRINIKNTNTATDTVSANTAIPELTNANTAAPFNTNAAPTSAVVVPITDFFNRITKKPFGIYITPKTSPIQPEKFTGYHAGADAETTPAEANADVPIYNIANGMVVFAGRVNGYGGVVIIQSTVSGEKITVLYGHVRISSFTIKKGNAIAKGEQIAVLGTGYSNETDGERKHLHLGIIKGTNINYKGYVSSQSQLSAWEDPVAWLKKEIL